MIKISVIIPTYNSGKTIERTLISIFEQKGLDNEFILEVIIVDDCSKDNTLEIIKKYPVKILINEINSGGPNKGRNLGLTISTGEWIIFTDHDDTWSEYRVIKLLSGTKYANIISCGFNIIKNNSILKTRVNKYTEDGLKYSKNETLKKIISRNEKGQVIFFGNLMIHKSLKNIKLEEKYGQCDVDYLLRLFKDRESYSCGNLPLYNRHIIGNENLSFNTNYRLNDYKMTLETYLNYLPEYKKEVLIGSKKLNASMARYFLKNDNFEESKYYLKKSKKGPVNLILLVLAYFKGIPKFLLNYILKL